MYPVFSPVYSPIFLPEFVGEFYSQGGGIFHFYCFCGCGLDCASALGAGDGDSSVTWVSSIYEGNEKVSRATGSINDRILR